METIKIKDKVQALEFFKKSAILYGVASEKGDHKMSNKNYDILIQIVSFLKEIKSLESLKELLFNTPDSVRLWAASFLLRIDEKEGISVLKSIANGSGVISLDAELTLNEWNAGNLTDL